MSKPKTPANHWSAAGQPDPFFTRYECEREDLCMGDMTDDELANAVFMHGNSEPRMRDLFEGKALMPIAYLTAAKDRIRWLSRSNERREANTVKWHKIAGEGAAEVERLSAKVVELEAKYQNMVEQRNKVADNLLFERTLPKVAQCPPAISDYELAELASSAHQTALSFGVSEEEFARLARTVRSRCTKAQSAGLRQFADELKQLCKDFSDRQDRPYMGDVTAAVDGLYEQFMLAAKGAE